MIYAYAVDFRVASYNVENLFDLKYEGNEYKEYIPNTAYGWNRKAYNIKLRNIAKVIKEIDADIIALQEVESRDALHDLRRHLNYRYFLISDKKDSSIQNAILSKYKISYSQELPIQKRGYRNILEVHIKIQYKTLILFINHWKSKAGAESGRIISARVLKKRLDNLNKKSEFILLGDFNSNYNEFKTFKKKRRLNDTDGITGINHILKTVKNGKIVTWDIFKSQNSRELLYNLWLDVGKKERWSHIYHSNRGSLDNMIISKTLANNRDIEYKKNSFNHFSPDWLFYRRTINRWQISRKQPRRHLLKGYSDHLPIYADFSSR